MKLVTAPRTTVSVEKSVLSINEIAQLSQHVFSLFLEDGVGYITAQMRHSNFLTGLNHDWSLVNSKGKLSKRILNILYKHFSIIPSDAWIGQMGGILKYAMMDKSSIVADIVDDFGWMRSEFGNPNSCYWTDYPNSRTTIRENGGMCIRQFDPDTGGGIGRLWLFQNGDDIIGFNLYGTWDVNQVSVIISKLLNNGETVYVTDIDLVSEYEIPYINHDSGFVFSSTPTIKYDYYKICWMEYCNDYNEYGDRIQLVECQECGDRVPENSIESAQGRSLCQYCYERMCDACGTVFFDRSDMVLVNDYLMEFDASRNTDTVPRAYGSYRFLFLCSTCVSEQKVKRCDRCGSLYIGNHDNECNYCYMFERRL